MASNTPEFLDSAATVGKLTKFAAQRLLNRRHFMSALGIAGAAAGSGLLSARPAVAQQPIHTGFSQVDVLNFLLNVKYLKATFYSYILTGADIPVSSGVTVGTGQIFNPLNKITFQTQQITDMLNEMSYDEVNQIVALRSLIASFTPGVPIGDTAVAGRPTMNLLGTGTSTVVALQTMTAVKALSVARAFEDLSATATAGAAVYLTGTNLSYVAQILGADGLHAGALRLAIIQQNAAGAAIPYLVTDSNITPATATITSVASPGNNITGQMVSDDVAPLDQGTAALASSGPVVLSTPVLPTAAVTVTNPCYDPQTASTAPVQTCTPTQYGGFFATAGGATTSASVSGTSGGFIFARTFSQVLSILYAPLGPGTYPAQINTFQGGYFPVGVNSAFNVV